MPTASFQFHGDLDVFLRREHVDRSFEFAFSGAPSLKDSIEALGVPHPEVEGITIDGIPARFEAPTPDGQKVDVYGVGELPESFDPAFRLLPPLSDERRFVLDTHLGTLASLLRMLGFDATWSSHAEDAALAAVSAEEDRILLSRDVGLLKRAAVTQGRFVRTTQPRLQAREIIERYALRDRARPFTRCMRCNGVLRSASKAAVAERVPPRVHDNFDAFTECPDCGRVYWAGSHHARMLEVTAALLR